MTDSATPNLPSRDFTATSQFYALLGFTQTWHDAAWLILDRGPLRLEFFPHPALDPAANWFSGCLRLDDLDGFYTLCRSAGVPEQTQGAPRLHPPTVQPWGARLAALIDADGCLLRLIQN